MISVIINDLVVARRTVLIITADDFQKLQVSWEQKDKLLVDLSKVNINFQNKTRWCDLNPTLYRLLIEKNIEKAAKLSDSEQADSTNPTMGSLLFLLTGFIRTFEIATDSALDLIRINRIGENEILYDYTGNMSDFASLKPEKTTLKVVVDNG